MRLLRALVAIGYLVASFIVPVPTQAAFPSGGDYTGVPLYVGPGDVTANVFASWWSCSRAYSLATAGSSACDIERASDSTSCTVTTNSLGNLDLTIATPCASSTTVTAWCANTTCRVIKLYDQAGGARPLTQATFANAPLFSFNTGAGGRAGMVCQSSRSTIISFTLGGTFANPLAVAVEAEQTSNAGNFTFAFESGSDSVGVVFDDVPNQVSLNAGGTIPATPVMALDGQPHSLISNAVTGTGTSGLIVDGVTFTGDSGGTQLQTNLSLCAQAGGGSTTTLDGDVFEAGIVTSGALGVGKSVPLALNMDTYYVLSDPTQTVAYQCTRRIYVNSSTGTPSGPGSSGSPYDIPSNAIANVSGGVQSGDCFQVRAGLTYNDNILFPTRSTGANFPNGWAVIESVDGSDLNVDAATHLTLNSGAAKIVSAVDNGTPVVGNLGSGALGFWIVRGLELTPKAATTSAVSCANFFNNGGYPQPNGFGSNHIVFMNNYLHDCTGAGIGVVAGDFYWFQNNVIINTASNDGFAQSCITIGQPRHPRNQPLQGHDASMPFANIISGNYCYNSLEYLVNQNNGSRTDAEAIILDDFANFQGSGGSSGQTNAGLYQYSTVVVNNVGFNNGGNCIQTNSVWYYNLYNNTCNGDGWDLANTSTSHSEFAIGGGANGSAYNNVAVSTGPWTYVTDTLVSPGTTLHVNDIRAASQFIHANGNFTYTVVEPSGSHTLPILINNNLYQISGYTPDVSNTCNASVAPGCVGGTLTLTSAVSVADGQFFNQANYQVQNNVAGGCSGTVTVNCSFMGYAAPFQLAATRGTTETVCDGLTTGCNPITLDMNGQNSVFGANVTFAYGGVGGFAGLNNATLENAFGYLATVLGNNVVADPAFVNPDYITANAAAGAGNPQGPGWLATSTGTTAPPNLGLIAAISPGVGLGTPGAVNGVVTKTYCPAIDILGAPRHCPTVTSGAYESIGAPLSYTGIGDVASTPPPLVYYGTTAYSKRGATGRLPALAINCNGDATTSFVININTSGVLDDASIDTGSGGGDCPGWKHNTASFTATIAAFAMNVSAVGSGAPSLGQIVTGAGVTALSKITACPGGTCGGTGVYTLSASSTVGSGTAMTSANTVFVQRAFEQVFGNRECDLVQTTHGSQPTLAFNAVSSKDTLVFSGSQSLGLQIVNGDQFCGIMFAQPSYLTVAEMTSGSSAAAVMDANAADSTLGFNSATAARWVSDGSTQTPASIDQTHYFSLFGVGNAVPGAPSQTGFIAVDDPTSGTTSTTFGGSLWQNQFTWGQGIDIAQFQATISGTTMTVTAVSSGLGASVLKAGQTITGAGVTGGTTILSQNAGGTFGGPGTYVLSASSTVGSTEPMTATLIQQGFTGNSPFVAIYGQPFNLTTLQVTPVALTQAQAQALYTNSLKPNFSLP